MEHLAAQLESRNRTGTILVASTTFLVGYILVKVVYRLFFHPLAAVPGPKLAALTWLVEFWHNTIRRGSYYLRIGEYHDKYGPIVRITPNEVHLKGIEAYDLIYRQHKFPKDADFYSSFSGDHHASLFIAASVAEQRARRGPLANMFSARAVSEIDWLIMGHVDNLCGRISSSSTDSLNGIDMHVCLRSLSLDVLSHFAFGKPFGLLGDERFEKEMYDTFNTIAPSIWPFRMMPKSVVYAITHMPGGGFPAMDRIFHLAKEQTRRIRQEIEGKAEDSGKMTHKTIFHELTNADLKLGDGKTMRMTDVQLGGEAASLTFAAAETTGSALEMTLLGVLADPEIHEKLRRELKEQAIVNANDPSIQAMAGLKYLTACIKEGLRLSHGAIGRLPRVVNDSNIVIHGHRLPIGTVVSSSNYHIHRDAGIFKDPHSFRPERWLESESDDLNRYLLSFGKGYRSCLGINLAWAELTATIGTLILRFPDMVIAEGSVERPNAVEYEDYFLSYVKRGGKTLLVRV